MTLAAELQTIRERDRRDHRMMSVWDTRSQEALAVQDRARLLDAVEKVLSIVENDAWTEQGTDFGHVTAVNADDIRDAITTALTA